MARGANARQGPGPDHGRVPRQLLVGIKQTIMAAMCMLVIAALAGMRDLGQQVLVALGRADLGLVAGFCIALLALIADRLLRDGTRKP